MNVMLCPFDVNLAVMIRSEIGSHLVRLLEEEEEELLTATLERNRPTPCVCGGLLLWGCLNRERSLQWQLLLLQRYSIGSHIHQQCLGCNAALLWSVVPIFQFGIVF